MLITDYLDPKIRFEHANLVLTLKFTPIFMELGTDNNSSMLIMNIIRALSRAYGIIISSE